jgi:hypothetical protein
LLGLSGTSLSALGIKSISGGSFILLCAKTRSNGIRMV